MQISGSGRSPGERNSYPLQYSCLKNSMDGGVWWATDHGVAKGQMTSRVSSITLRVSLRKETCVTWSVPQKLGNSRTDTMFPHEAVTGKAVSSSWN